MSKESRIQRPFWRMITIFIVLFFNPTLAYWGGGWGWGGGGYAGYIPGAYGGPGRGGRYGGAPYGPHGGGQADPWNGNWAGNAGGHISRNYDIGYAGPSYRRIPQPRRPYHIAAAMRTLPSYPYTPRSDPRSPVFEDEGESYMLSGRTIGPSLEGTV